MKNRLGNSFVHDGSLCKCERRAVLLHPRRDSFLCCACLTAYDKAAVADDVDWPVSITASHLSVATQNTLQGMFGESVGVADSLEVGSVAQFVDCQCGCRRMECKRGGYLRRT